MKLLSVIGARPQFIKALPLSLAIRGAHQEVLIHTGQHYDYEMSQIFFEGLNLPEPDYNLGIGSLSHGVQTGKMLAEIEKIIEKESPDILIVYGDTNSTLAGALAASKLGLPVAHVEAGLRSYNREMPEEINRVLTDHISTYLFCPTPTALRNLKKEGITHNVYNVGDVMFDAARDSVKKAELKSDILEKLKLKSASYVVATIHRPINTDSAQNLLKVLRAIGAIKEKVIFPVHPRTKNLIDKFGLWGEIERSGNFTCIKPLGYLDFIKLQKHARVILTDSGGVQKEAWFYNVPCITLRGETEWVETVKSGWNIITGADPGKVKAAYKKFTGSGFCPKEKIKKISNASKTIVSILERKEKN